MDDLRAANFNNPFIHQSPHPTSVASLVKNSSAAQKSTAASVCGAG
jgi:hypothetical protein